MKKILAAFLMICMILSFAPCVSASGLEQIEFAGRSDVCDFFSNGMAYDRNSVDTASGGECALLREAGEWVSYDISSLVPGTYSLTVKLLNNYAYQAIFGVYIDDVLNISYATYRTASGWGAGNHTETDLGKVYVFPGAKEIKIKNDGVGANIEISHISLVKASDGDTAPKDITLWTSNVTSKEDYSDYWAENPDGPAPSVMRTAGVDYYIQNTESYTFSGNFRNWQGQNYAILRAGDWARYDIRGMKPGTYAMTVSQGSSAGTKLDFLIDGKIASETPFAAKGNYNMEETDGGKIYIPQGAQQLVIRNGGQAVFMEYLKLKYESGQNTTLISKTYPVPVAQNGMTEGMTTDPSDYKNGIFYDSAHTGLQSMSGKTVVLYGTEWIKFKSVTELPPGTYNISMPTCTQAGRATEITVKTIDNDGNVMETITHPVAGTGVNWGAFNISFADNIHITKDVAGLIFENGAGNYGYGVSEITLSTAYDSYDVGFSAENAVISGEETVTEGQDYTFAVSPNSGAQLYSVSASVKGELPQNRNSGEGETAGTLFMGEADNLIEMTEDTDSPMAGVLRYKRVFEGTGGGTVYSDISSVMSEKPSVISFGFWIKEPENIFGDTGMVFSPVLQSGSYISVELPVSYMISYPRREIKLAPYETNGTENIFTAYSVSAECTARSGSWAHVVCSMENLEYPADYNAAGAKFCLSLDNAASAFALSGAQLEMSNFTYITNEKIKSGYIVYPQNTEDKSYTVAAEKLTDGTYLIPKEAISGNITIKAAANLTPQEGYEPMMQAKTEGESLFVRTSYDEENDLIQKFIGIYSDGIDSDGEDANEPVDFSSSGLIPKSSSNMTRLSTMLSGGFDEASPFKYNYSYIGANHGQSNGIYAVSQNHGKTYADIGSVWTDAAGKKWNLLKIKDKDTLLFISDNQSADNNKYTFRDYISGSVLTCADARYAENTSDINVESTQTRIQLRHAIKKLELSVYAVIDGARHKMTGDETAECDSVEIVERYYIMNPALIAKALRENRPEGGYTEPQSLAVGEPVIDYNMIYRIMPDGTVISEFNHKILENINFDWYSAIMYQLRSNAYGGGVYRYIPKSKSFDMTLNGETYTYDFTGSVNVTEAVKNNNYIGYSEKHLTSELWENPESMPDRQIDYMYDTSDNVRAGFAAGYLPVSDGEPSKRLEMTSSANYLYRSGKAYPIFANSRAFSSTGTKNRTITGVAYKKYVDTADKTASMYTIPYGDDTYIYIDFHEDGTREFVLSDILKTGASLEELEKSENITYSVSGGKITVSASGGTYGYLTLRAKLPEIEALSIEKDITAGNITASFRNNSLKNTSAEIVIAAYKNGRMTEMKTEMISLGGKQRYNVGAEFAPGSFDEVKAFVWESAEGLMPVSAHVVA